MRTPCDSVIGIDPGLGTGGAVCLRVADAHLLGHQSFVTAPAKRPRAERFSAGDYDWAFADAMVSARAQAERITAWVRAMGGTHAVTRVSMESFVDQKSHARHLRKERWKTPLVIAALTHLLGDEGFDMHRGTLVFQDAGTVLRQFSDPLNEIGEWARQARQNRSHAHALSHLSNEHLRAAWAHAMWTLVRLHEERGTTPPLWTGEQGHS